MDGNPEKDSNQKDTLTLTKIQQIFIDENVVKGQYHSVRKVDCPSDVEGRYLQEFFYYISSVITTQMTHHTKVYTPPTNTPTVNYTKRK